MPISQVNSLKSKTKLNTLHTKGKDGDPIQSLLMYIFKCNSQIAY